MEPSNSTSADANNASGGGAQPVPPPVPARAISSRAAALPTRTHGPSKQPWLWNVVLLDDQEHTDVYVIRMMQELFAMSPQKATQIADAVDGEGRAIVATTHKELAELKRDQILAFGKDPQVGSCSGSMSALIEPAVDPSEG
jgi:ATP-dependent Clp protease adaptor protein ClpS